MHTKIATPEIEIISFSNEDVIVTSVGGENVWSPVKLTTDGWYYSKSTEYEQFGGRPGTFSTTGWFRFMLDSKGRMYNERGDTQEYLEKDPYNYAWYNFGEGWWTFNKKYGEYGDTKPKGYD